MEAEALLDAVVHTLTEMEPDKFGDTLADEKDRGTGRHTS